jgi:hypothetical protein
MPEHMKAMQETMTMMEDMRSGGMGMGMMGGTDNATMMGKMPMDMMQSMMQMMMDRMQVPATK